MLLPALNSAREVAREINCVNNLKQFGTANAFYINDNDGWIYRYYDVDSGTTWHTKLNSYLGNKWKMKWGLIPAQGVWRCDSNKATGATKYIFYESAYAMNNRLSFKKITTVKRHSEIALTCSAGWDNNQVAQRAAYELWDAVEDGLYDNVGMGFWHNKSKIGTASFLDGHATALTRQQAIKPTSAAGTWSGILNPPGSL